MSEAPPFLAEPSLGKLGERQPGLALRLQGEECLNAGCWDNLMGVERQCVSGGHVPGE